MDQISSWEKKGCSSKKYSWHYQHPLQNTHAQQRTNMKKLLPCTYYGSKEIPSTDSCMNIWYAPSDVICTGILERLNPMPSFLSPSVLSTRKWRTSSSIHFFFVLLCGPINYELNPLKGWAKSWLFSSFNLFFYVLGHSCRKAVNTRYQEKDYGYIFHHDERLKVYPQN